MNLYLTTEKYRNILNNIGKSPEPLLISEIRSMLEKAGLKKTSSPYVYDMIRELAPTESSPSLLFRWDNLPEGHSNNKLRGILRKLSNTFRLGWTLDEDPKYTPDYNDFFNKINNNSLIISPISDPTKKYLTINLLGTREGTLSVMNDKKISREYSITVRKNSRKTYVYLNMMTSVRPKTFLSATPRRDQRTISQIKQEIQKNENYSHLWGFDLLFKPDFPRDSREIYNFRYRLNIRGLILYVLTEIEFGKNNKGKRMSQLNTVLENLSKNFVEDFPFLLHYRDFKNLFGGESYYLPKLMRQVAMELHYQVFSADIRFLMYWVLKRFSEEVIRHLVTPIVWGMGNGKITGNVDNFEDKLKQYELRSISLLADYHKKEHQFAEADRLELINNRLVSRF